MAAERPIPKDGEEGGRVSTPEEREQAARVQDPAKTFARTLRFIATREDQAGESDRFLAANALELHPEFWEPDVRNATHIDE